MAKTIKISEENYRWLLQRLSEMQKIRGEKMSFDDTINELKNVKRKGSLLQLAGKWKMSDKEANNLIEEIYEERKIISRRL